MSNDYHTPVLVENVLEYLLTTPDGVYIDATIGGGGHGEHILHHLSPKGKLIGFDVDGDAITFAQKRLSQFGDRIVLIQENFVHMQNVLEKNNIHTINGILLDLGISSSQIDQSGKGFSFQRNEPLDMRMDTRQSLSAAALLRTVEEKELQRILMQYGEERYARKIAKAIAHKRSIQSIETTGALASIVEKIVGQRFLMKSLARVFQALRIAVNDELNNLRLVLRDIVELLNVGGRIVVISYHSLEDRLVKEFFKSESANIIASGHKLVPDLMRSPRLRILTKKPILPSEAEIAMNSRARSAKLRAAERV